MTEKSEVWGGRQGSSDAGVLILLLYILNLLGFRAVILTINPGFFVNYLLIFAAAKFMLCIMKQMKKK